MTLPKTLSYDLAPDPAVVFFCLVPAPLLSAGAGIWLAFAPAQGFPERFSGLTLALVHWMMLAVALPVILGALMQLLPVVAAVRLRAPRIIRTMLAPLCWLTAASVIAGFSGMTEHTQSAFALAAVSGSVLLSATAFVFFAALRSVDVVDNTTLTLRYIPLALCVVLFAGVLMAAVFGNLALPALSVGWLLNVHVGVASVAWLAALLAGIASTTVPMFWQTPRPHHWFQKLFPASFWLTSLLLLVPVSQTFALLCMSIAVIVCASWSLLALLQAKRRNDPGYLLWLFACAGWITGAMITFALHCDWLTDSNWQWLAGVLVLVGGVWLPVNAMLVKIIPFLVFLHLRRRLPARSKIPPMQMLLPVKQARWQAKAQIACLLLLLAIPLQTGLLRAAAGLGFAFTQIWLGALLLRVLWKFRVLQKT